MRLRRAHRLTSIMQVAAPGQVYEDHRLQLQAGPRLESKPDPALRIYNGDLQVFCVADPSSRSLNAHSLRRSSRRIRIARIGYCREVNHDVDEPNPTVRAGQGRAGRPGRKRRDRAGTAFCRRVGSPRRTSNRDGQTGEGPPRSLCSNEGGTDRRVRLNEGRAGGHSIAGESRLEIFATFRAAQLDQPPAFPPSIPDGRTDREAPSDPRSDGRYAGKANLHRCLQRSAVTIADEMKENRDAVVCEARVGVTPALAALSQPVLPPF